MDAPKCRICEERHWGLCPGVTISKSVTKSKPSLSTDKPFENVTLENVTQSIPKGGRREGSGRKRVFDSGALKQRAYRGRPK